MRPFLLGSTLLTLIFAGFSVAIRLQDAANGLITPATVAKLTALNTIISLEILLPTALFLSTLTALGRLYRDGEMAAMLAAGISEMRILIAVLKISIAAALLVGFLSLFGRPWAYQHTYGLEAQAQEKFQASIIESSSF